MLMCIHFASDGLALGLYAWNKNSLELQTKLTL